mmetsp:Transcript_87739/g.249621  ORF Transcript_87739/g.249621 Transcript_87739/m.249621 type:complete len:202 (-) Transcript_87739:188-793(-)
MCLGHTARKRWPRSPHLSRSLRRTSSTRPLELWGRSNPTDSFRTRCLGTCMCQPDMHHSSGDRTRIALPPRTPRTPSGQLIQHSDRPHTRDTPAVPTEALRNCFWLSLPHTVGRSPCSCRNTCHLSRRLSVRASSSAPRSVRARPTHSERLKAARPWPTCRLSESAQAQATAKQLATVLQSATGSGSASASLSEPAMGLPS